MSRAIAFILILVTGALVQTSAHAQATSASLDSYTRARQVLEEAIEAHGGRERLWSIDRSSIEFRGVLHSRFQSPSPEPPFQARPTRERLRLDVDALTYERSIEYPDFEFSERVHLVGSSAYRVDPASGRVTAADTAFVSRVRGLYRRSPIRLLRRLADRPASLRWLGATGPSSAREDVLTFVDVDGRQVTLYIDGATRRLSGYDYLYDDLLFGDATRAIDYLDYHEVDGVMMPRRIVLREGDTVVADLDVEDVAFDGPPLPAPPVDRADASTDSDPAPAEASDERVREIAPDVYLIERLAGAAYNVLFVAFDEYVLVVETPLDPEAARRAIAAIERTVPDRPIRFAAPTHHHSDHAGGVLAFAAAGAAVVTTPGNASYFQRILTAPRTLAPVGPVPAQPMVEIVEEGRRVFSDRDHHVELLDFGPNGHAREHLVAWLPRHRLVFQGDLVVFPESGPIEPARPQGVAFARRIDELGLDVERIAGVHGRIGTISELREAVARASANE